MTYPDTPRLFRLRKRKEALTADLKLKLDRTQRRNLEGQVLLLEVQIEEILLARKPIPTVTTPQIPITDPPEQLLSKEGKLQRIATIEALEVIQTRIKDHKSHRWVRRTRNNEFRAIGSREKRRNWRNRLKQLQTTEGELWEHLRTIR